MLKFFQRIFAWLSGRVSSFFGQGFLLELAKWTATKLLITAFLTIGIYIIANNLIVFIVSKIVENVSTFSNQGSINPAIVQLTGLGAYFAGKLKIVPSVSLIVTGFSIRAIRQFLPF